MLLPKLETTATVELAPELRATVATRLDDYFALQAAIAGLEANAAAIKANVEKAFTDAGEGRTLDSGVTVEGHGRAKMVYPTTSRLDKKKLVSLGVTVQQIERATVTSPGMPYLKLTKPGRGGEGD